MMVLRFHSLADLVTELEERNAGTLTTALDLRVDIDRSIGAVIVTARMISLKDVVLRFEKAAREPRFLADIRGQFEAHLRDQGWTVRPGAWEV